MSGEDATRWRCFGCGNSVKLTFCWFYNSTALFGLGSHWILRASSKARRAGRGSHRRVARRVRRPVRPAGTGRCPRRLVAGVQALLAGERVERTQRSGCGTPRTWLESRSHASGSSDRRPSPISSSRPDPWPRAAAPAARRGLTPIVELVASLWNVVAGSSRQMASMAAPNIIPS